MVPDSSKETRPDSSQLNSLDHLGSRRGPGTGRDLPERSHSGAVVNGHNPFRNKD